MADARRAGAADRAAPADGTLVMRPSGERAGSSRNVAAAGTADAADAPDAVADSGAGDTSDKGAGSAQSGRPPQSGQPERVQDSEGSAGAEAGQSEPERAEADREDAEANGAEADGAGAETGGKRSSGAVDQPTAVFHAFQKRAQPRPEVDQPTAVFTSVTPGSTPARANGEPAEPDTHSAEPDPATAAPTKAAPTKAEPSKAAPADAATSDAGTSDTRASDAARADAGPSNAARAAAVPGDAVPGGGTPTDAAPAKNASAKQEAAKHDPAKPAPASAAAEPTGPAAGKAAPQWAAADTDGDAERTSRFVPLRPGDARAAKPAAGGPAATAPAAADSSADAAGAEAPAESSTASVTATVPTPASLTEAERTRQQPVPPLPPLDLLAELTNTPPPPETLLRTTARRVKIWTPLVLLLVIVFATVQLLRPLPEPTLRLTAEESYTFQGGTLDMPWPGEGQGAVEVEGVGLIGTYGPQKPQPTASVAKAMTAYVILKGHPLKDKDGGPKIEIDKLTEEQASNPDWSVAPVKEGQVYTQGELLQLLMVQSANNVAHLLARWDAGSEEAFLKKMNDAAKELGMKDTVYTDPSGFEKTTVSTPLDQLKLAKAAMQDKVFREIVDLPQITLPQIGHTLHNGNRILLKGGVAGIKTGTSTPAGGNLLWAAYTKVDGKLRRILGVVMGVKSPQQLHLKTKLAIETYSYDLIKKAQDGVVSQTVVEKGEVVGHIDDGLGGRTPVVATEDLKPVGWGGLTVDLELTDGGKALPGSAPDGTVVGTLTVGEGEGRVAVPVALQKDLEEPGIGAKLTRLG
ncbi:serine hydrolase [Streptomyces sp. CC228A]|uniref:serine hydrolase n=1 Tax=Streptomyces sp. CC228A TaxID=2898186 RepID=UPI001F3B6D87|nr:serine hydrolase [Streptomyces sp. CC228A]